MSAVQRPTADGLVLCQMVIVEEGTRNVTLANSFQRLEFTSFPSPPIPMTAYVMLADGLGDVELELTVLQCATLDEVYLRSRKVVFRNPLHRVRLRWQIRSCSFPEPGNYEFAINGNRERIVQSVVEVAEKGQDHA